MKTYHIAMLPGDGVGPEVVYQAKRVLEAEVRRRLRKELEFAYQTQGYETNYDIEVWLVNDWSLL